MLALGSLGRTKNGALRITFDEPEKQSSYEPKKQSSNGRRTNKKKSTKRPSIAANVKQAFKEGKIAPGRGMFFMEVKDPSNPLPKGEHLAPGDLKITQFLPFNGNSQNPSAYNMDEQNANTVYPQLLQFEAAVRKSWQKLQRNK
jgi:hypothetical protein